MSTKTISIKTEAYNMLKSFKTGSKSFSDVILDLTARKRKLSDFFGIWSRERGKSALKELHKYRSDFDRDVNLRKNEVF